MYAPPQPYLNASHHTIESHHKFGAGLLEHIRHNPTTEPFSYEYVLEEGKLPVLAEFRPKKRDNQTTQNLSRQPHSQSSSTMRRSRSLKRSDKNLQFDISTYKIQQPAQERTSDKLKRAFSLSGMRSSSQSRRHLSKSHITDAPPVPRRPDNLAAPPPESRVPSLVLPTPSPSPEPIRNSYHSNYKTPINYSLPRSSWASYDEDFDLAFLRESAVGRLSPTPFPTTELRRDKALALLGITDFPLSPLYTPAPSTAPSVRDYHSRVSSRRPSAEHRRSQHIPESEEPKQLPDIPSAYEEETPKAIQQEQPQILEAQESSIASSRPPMLRRKTSKFIEHIDGQEEKLCSPLSPPLVVVTESKSSIQRSTTVPILLEPQPPNSSQARRSVSMRHRSPTPSTWGAVVCTAHATPIVATGHARMIQS